MEDGRVKGEERPRVIIGVSSAQRTRHLELRGKYKILHPPEAEIVVVDSFHAARDPFLQELIEDGTLQVGVILVRSPFGNDQYAPLDRAAWAFERQKILLIAELCRILGASTVQTKASSLDVRDERASVRGKVGRRIVRKQVFTAEGNYDRQQRSQYADEISINATYPGMPADIDRARSFAKGNHILDGDVEALISARSGSQAVTEYTLTVVYETKRDQNMQIGLKVAIPTLSGEGTYKRSSSAVARISMDLKASFAMG